jgi:putative hydrolase of the HAD superfamily
MTITTIFFDLDDTLYDKSNRLWDAIRDRMNLYMLDKLRIAPDQVGYLRRHYYENYGTTLRGLQLHYNINADDYLAFVHDLPLENYIRPNPELRRLLQSIPQSKYVFTNADSDHADRVLRILDILDCFLAIIDIRAMNYHCKPEEEAYRTALEIAGVRLAHGCLMIDDSSRNLAKARELGFTTVLVGKDGNFNGIDFEINSLIELPQVLPQIISFEN